MARIRVSGASGSSENTIVFIPSGGHSHDGVTSSLISTEKYSIYDFSPSFVNSNQSQTRAVRQENNRIAFESLIVRVVNQSVLNPAGIVLSPGSLNASTLIANTVTALHLAANTITADEIAANTITADQIASNTITADELVSNVVLVNNIIRSNVYTPGSAGWKISNDGSAEFSDVVVRGNIYSNVGTIGGWTLSSSSLASGTGSTTLYSNGAAVIGNTTIAANGRITNGSFTLSSTGALTATGANISGVITATSGSFAGSVTAGNTSIYANGQITNGNFTVSSTGALSATGANIAGVITTTSGTIGGWTINSNSITGITAGGNTSTFSSVASSLSLHGEYASQYAYALISPGYISVFGETLTTQIRGNRIDTTDVFATNFYGTASDASKVGGFVAQTSDGASTVAVRSAGDGALRAQYFVTSGTVTVGSSQGTTLRRRNTDGYILADASRLRYKEDIQTVLSEEAIDLIKNLRPVKFQWKKEFRGPDGPNPLLNEINNKNKEYGFIAEEVYQVSPELVSYLDDNEDGTPDPNMWQQNGVISLCVASIKELLSKINILEGRIQELENKV
jgi:hypothetical protein